MVVLSSYFRGAVHADFKHPSKSRVEVYFRHERGWKPLFILTAADLIAHWRKAKAAAPEIRRKTK